MTKILAILTTAVILVFQSGCAVNRSSATVESATRWESIKSLHVAKAPPDGRGIHLLIAEKLKSKGFSVTADPQTMANPDALVTYTDKWMWDITMYMIELTIVFRDPTNDFPLARGNSYHTSLTRKSPKEMVEEVVDNITKDRK